MMEVCDRGHNFFHVDFPSLQLLKECNVPVQLPSNSFRVLTLPLSPFLTSPASQLVICPLLTVRLASTVSGSMAVTGMATDTTS